MFSLETQTILGKMLRIHIDVEHDCEKMRQGLSRNREFNSHQVFLALDRDNNGYITMDEVSSVKSVPKSLLGAEQVPNGTRTGGTHESL